ncbi:DUF6114 domain-containing protein [Streptomyces caatingaensis]|uniref:Uncharacterized protein n=1 Tax=Streptomyces caatingaensis TaxID=1678637 RepID=A0A0K9XBH2_9ACTN|nr:DUF6114 domain-containing protein [Streptomyces caatingaensis]KNB50456.1 hypothetical protein AC230_20985 [Streptomyces caatingaensis]
MLLTASPHGRWRAWRRGRPFWAGTLLLLAGAELVAAPLAPVRILLGLGRGGIAALGLGAALVLAGLSLWFLPHAHHYIGIHAMILAVLAFPATNLGGFLAGTLLGIAGGAMGFAWQPGTGPAPGARTPPPPRAMAAALPLVLLTAHLAPAAPPAARPAAAAVPPAVTTTRFAPDGPVLARVVELPTASGPLRVMALSMRAASLSDYRLRTRDGTGHDLTLGAGTLRLTGRVTLYLTRFSGCVEGLMCLTFTPDGLPVPPLVPPLVFLTDVTAEQALVTSDVLVTDGLDLAAEPRR